MPRLNLSQREHKLAEEQCARGLAGDPQFSKGLLGGSSSNSPQKPACRWTSKDRLSAKGAGVGSGEEGSWVIQKQVSDSSTQAPPTPVTSDLKPHVTFDLAKEHKVRR